MGEQHPKNRVGTFVAEVTGPPEGALRALYVTHIEQYVAQFKGGLSVVFTGASICAHRPNEIATLLKDSANHCGRIAVPGRFGLAEVLKCFRNSGLVAEQQPQVEDSVCAPSCDSAPVGGFGTPNIAKVTQQVSKAHRRLDVPTLFTPQERRLSQRGVAPSRVELPEQYGTLCVSELIGLLICKQRSVDIARSLTVPADPDELHSIHNKSP